MDTRTQNTKKVYVRPQLTTLGQAVERTLGTDGGDNSEIFSDLLSWN